jgi:hypothetical protein
MLVLYATMTTSKNCVYTCIHAYAVTSVGATGVICIRRSAFGAHTHAASTATATACSTTSNTYATGVHRRVSSEQKPLRC